MRKSLRHRFCLGAVLPVVALAALPALAGEKDDVRTDFQASGFTGIGIDSFAGSELTTYLNPNASGEIQERGVAGIDFSYRLINRSNGIHQFWVYGQTVYGVRSSDVDCQKNPTLAVCSGFDAANPSAGTLYMLRNATSLEAFLGFRWEFYDLQPGSISSAKVYLKAQSGFLTISRGGGDVVDIYHAGIGAIITNGRFQDSFLEVGFGRTDLFAVHSTRRCKVDGMLTWVPTAAKKKNIGFFAELTVDADCGGGADAVQTYLGFVFDLDEIK